MSNSVVFLVCWFGAVQGPPAEARKDLPGDQPRQFARTIERTPTQYAIAFQGTVDGRMTRGPIGYAAFTQGWQPNRSVLIENVGRGLVRNPRIEVNGRAACRSLAEIVTAATKGYTTDADRVRAIWEFWRRHRFHATTWDRENQDAVKSLHVYGYTLCGNEAVIVNDLWKAAGLKTRRGRPVGHCVTEVFYDDRWHLLDSDEHVICLLRDNRTVASEPEVVNDHDLIKRTHTYGILNGEDRRTDEFSASLYGYEGERKGDFGDNTRHTMDMLLRPGESIELRWDHAGKQYTAGQAPKPGEKLSDGLGDLLSGWGTQAYSLLRNGKWRYKPDLRSETALAGAESWDGAVLKPDQGVISPSVSDKPGSVTWSFSSPYVFVGGKASTDLRIVGSGSARWSFSTDGKKWQTVVQAETTSSGPLVAALDELLSPRAKPAYRFWLRLELQGNAAASSVAFEHDIQTSTLMLPELSVGLNQVVYRDDSSGPRQVHVTHRWVERTSWHPPQAPAQAVAPTDGQTVSGTKVAFRWTPAADPDGDTIADYHFELSEHADMRWPLSPNFERLVSRTPARGKSEWTIPYAGLLNPDTSYYWHVRACDARGVWGPWSRVFSFRVRSPGLPLDVRLVPDGQQGFRLTWRAHSQGERPAAYKVYGSDERGFSVSDQSYRVFQGKGFVRSMDEFVQKPGTGPDIGSVEHPANLIARVAECSLPVVGPELTGSNVNRAYYRVVAVDAAGNESGASDFAEVPRPWVSSRHVTLAQTGQPYRYQPQVIRSLGDLRCRVSRASSYNAAFWDREEITFEPKKLPEWMSLDAKSGLLSGTPSKPGRYDVQIRVVASSGKTRDVDFALDVANRQP